MKNLKCSVILGLGGVLSSSGFGCDLCSIYSAAQSRGELGRGFFAGAAEQFTHFGTLQTDGERVPNPSGQFLNSSISQLFAGYNLNDRFGLQLNLPMIYRSFERPEGGAIDKGSESGLGDISLLAHFGIIRAEDKNRTFSWNLLGGVKFPTGDTRRLYEEVLELSAPPPSAGSPASGIHGHDLTLGSGSVDGVIGTSLFAREKRTFVAASVQYSIRSKGDFAYRFANDLAWSGGPGYLIALNDQYTFAFQINFSGEYKGRDTFQSATADDTGVTAIYLGPQLSVTWGDKLSAELGADFPLCIHNTSFQAVPDYRIRGGLTWRF